MLGSVLQCRGRSLSRRSKVRVSFEALFCFECCCYVELPLLMSRITAHTLVRQSIMPYLYESHARYIKIDTHDS